MRYPVLVLALLLVLAGCGGGDSKGSERAATTQRAGETPSKSQSEPGGEEEERSGLESIPDADRHAFVRIATTTGNLSVGASVLLVRGLARQQDLDSLRRLRPEIRALRPRDAGLRALRRKLLAAIARAIEARRSHPTATDARRMLTAAAQIRAGLKRYAGQHPAIGAVAPD
jgi:hypothetical protein